MLSKETESLKAPSPGDLKAASDEVDGAVLDPHCKIEVASSGNGTINDPAASDNKPPGCADLDLLV